MKHTDEQIKNCLISELANLISDFNLDRLNEEDIYRYFSHFLIDANVDSEIVVSVLEYDYFGRLGKEEARNIKVDEGW